MKIREAPSTAGRWVHNTYQILKKNWKDKFFWQSVLIYMILPHLLKIFYKNNGIYVMDEDWDNLIILDCCRYDTFVKVSGIECEFRISRGSCTKEFLIENFHGKKYLDTIYITANPFVDKYVKDCFYKVISVWKTDWNEKYHTVLPQSVVKRALETEKKYPDKRLIIHFMQPHIPFIKNPELNILGWGEKSTFKILNRNLNEKGVIPSNPWKEVGRGNIDLATVYKAYERNLEAVLPYAFKLAYKLNGKTVITSDHGQALNDRLWPLPIKIIDHPCSIYIPSLFHH